MKLRYCRKMDGFRVYTIKWGTLHTFLAGEKATKALTGVCAASVAPLWLCTITWKRGQRTRSPVRMLAFVLGNPSRLTKIKHCLKENHYSVSSEVSTSEYFEMGWGDA